MLQTAEKFVTEIIPQGSNLIPVNKKIRMAAYCRVSTDSVEQEHSFEAQYEYYTEMINGMPECELVGVYADDGISGRGTSKREDFNRLISDCKKGNIDKVITKSVSRFARNTVDCLETVRILAMYGVSVYFEKEDIDTAKMTNEMLLAISGMQAQEESISHGNNMRWSYKKRMENGEYLGNIATYGYTLINSGKVIINEAEAKVVRLIKDLYLSGWGFKKITDYLNNNNIRRRSGKRWYITTIRYILTNERYIGDALLQKKITTFQYPPQRLINDGSQPQYYVTNCLPPIITKEERTAILELLEIRNGKPHIKTAHKLARLLYCNDCNHAFRRVVRKERAVWRCNYYSGGRDCENAVTVDEEDVIQMFKNMLNKLYLNRENFLLPILEKLERMQSKLNGTEIKIKALDAEIAKLSKQNLVLAELIKNGILDIADFHSQQNDISIRLSELRKKRRDILNEKDDNEIIKAFAELNELLEDIENVYDYFDEDIIRAIVKKAIVISATEIKIELRCGLILTEYLPTYYSKRRKCA